MMIACSHHALHSSNNLYKKDFEYLYGVGYGKKLNIAKENAIKDLITNLQVSVKFTSQNTTMQNNQSLETIGNASTFLESSFNNLTGVEIDDVRHEKNNITVRVKIAKTILQAQIMQKVQNAQDFLESSTNKCGSPSFKEFKKFQAAFKEWQNNISLLQSLTKNSYEIQTQQYASMIAHNPNYNLVIDFKSISQYQQEIANILTTELNKFITINKAAKNTVHVQIIQDKEIHLYFTFNNCKGEIEHSLHINTYMPESSLSDANNKTRLGAIIYKNILDSL
ncbi:LPP20 family lipoprotein [Helicobacter sp. MIT 14-3879]|uniref:LPP20 family lipoprotein n=1 Tax=Helicobacter sp. MIT 14-3879 TaxID=2040649 RepID=UPI0015F12E15|nr:LPP20 family lipoprotein [Helicobacter sp. MIT 14-3879]